MICKSSLLITPQRWKKKTFSHTRRPSRDALRSENISKANLARVTFPKWGAFACVITCRMSLCLQPAAVDPFRLRRTALLTPRHSVFFASSPADFSSFSIVFLLLQPLISSLQRSRAHKHDLRVHAPFFHVWLLRRLFSLIHIYLSFTPPPLHPSFPQKVVCSLTICAKISFSPALRFLLRLRARARARSSASRALLRRRRSPATPAADLHSKAAAPLPPPLPPSL